MAFHERLAVLVLFLIGVAFLQVKLTEAISAEEPQTISGNKVPRSPASVPGQFVVRLKNSIAEIDQETFSTIETNMRGHILRKHVDINVVIVQKPAIQNSNSAKADILMSGYALLVEPNYIYHADRTPNDVDFGKLWGLKNLGQAVSTGPQGISGIDIEIERGWEITTGREQHVVAVIDTGVDYNHTDLKENMWTNATELNGQAGVDDDGNGIVDDIYGANFTDPKAPSGEAMDDNGHGTHCAGVIGARGDNGIGVVGVNWKTKIMAVKFLDANGNSTLENALKAIDYAVKMGAKVLSNSWSGGGYSQILRDSVERAHQAGVVFVAAASNNGENSDVRPAYPAAYPIENVISVAALNNRAELAEFSNYGATTVHLAAPGKDVYSTMKGDTYEILSGTSMATPYVAGVAALLWGQEPQLTHLEVKERILAGSRPLASLRKKTVSGGFLNAYYTLTKQSAPEDPNDPIHWPQRRPLQISTPHPYPQKQDLTFEVHVPGAREIALHFQKIELEHFFDTIYLSDRSGQIVGKINDQFEDMFSPVIQGDYVKIILRSDDTVEKYGFDLTGVAYR